MYLNQPWNGWILNSLIEIKRYIIQWEFKNLTIMVTLGVDCDCFGLGKPRQNSPLGWPCSFLYRQRGWDFICPLSPQGRRHNCIKSDLWELFHWSYTFVWWESPQTWSHIISDSTLMWFSYYIGTNIYDHRWQYSYHTSYGGIYGHFCTRYFD